GARRCSRSENRRAARHRRARTRPRRAASGETPGAERCVRALPSAARPVSGFALEPQARYATESIRCRVNYRFTLRRKLVWVRRACRKILEAAPGARHLRERLSAGRVSEYVCYFT